MQNPAARRNKFLLALATTTLALIAIELAFRVRLPLDLDPLASSDRPEYYFPIQTPSWVAAGTNPVRRIAVVGDSFTEGGGVQRYSRYGEVLEFMLNARDVQPPFVVRVNAHSGFSTFQEHDLLTEVLAWNPELVMIGICLNDTEDWTQPQKIHRWRARMQPQVPPGRWKDVISASRVLSIGWLGFQRLRARGGYVEYYRHLYDPEYSGWRRFGRALRQYQRETAEADTRLLAVIMPLMSHPFDRGRYPFEFAHEALHQALAERGIDYLDVLEAFRGKVPLRMMTVPNVDPHPSEIAHRLIAECVFDYLLAKGYIPPECAPGPHRTQTGFQSDWERAANMITLRELFVPAPGESK